MSDEEAEAQRAKGKVKEEWTAHCSYHFALSFSLTSYHFALGLRLPLQLFAELHLTGGTNIRFLAFRQGALVRARTIRVLQFV